MEPKPAKQLRELLQEQQEPFILELHLLERGCLRKNLNPENDFSSCCGKSRKSLKKSVHHRRNKNSKAGPHCSQVIKVVYNQVISINERLRIKTSSHDTERDRNKQAVTELDRFSSASSTTVYNSCYGSDAEETSTSLPKEGISMLSLAENTSKSVTIFNQIEEVATDRKLGWRCIEDSKQLSPVSVLGDIPLYGGSPLHGNKTEGFTTRKEENPSKASVICSKKITEGSTLSASLWKVLFPSETEKPISAGVTELQELVQSNASLQYFKSKRVFQQTKQLMFDCVKEVIETRGRQQQQHHCRTYLASEELGKLIGEKILTWGSHTGGDGSNLKKLLYSNLLGTEQEWSGYEQHRREIGADIEDAIFKEIINEIVADMIKFTTPPFFRMLNRSQNYQMLSRFQNLLLHIPPSTEL